MPTLNLLYKDRIPITDQIHVMIPKIGDVIDNEDTYNDLVSYFTAMPIDMMVQLDDAGIDFTTINAYELFVLLFGQIKTLDTKLILGDLDLTKFEIVEDPESGKFGIVCPETGAYIDRSIHYQIASTLRMLNHIEKNNKRPANQEAKEYMIKRARERMKRRKNHQENSQLESLIVAMVNTEQFKYNYEQVREISIYQFMESVHQIIQKVNCEHKLNAVYAGTINPNDLGQDELNWLSHK